MVQLAQTTMRSELGKIKLDSCVSGENESQPQHRRCVKRIRILLLSFLVCFLFVYFIIESCAVGDLVFCVTCRIYQLGSRGLGH